jgi:hypothetical protein
MVQGRAARHRGARTRIIACWAAKSSSLIRDAVAARSSSMNNRWFSVSSIGGRAASSTVAPAPRNAATVAAKRSATLASISQSRDWVQTATRKSPSRR